MNSSRKKKSLLRAPKALNLPISEIISSISLVEKTFKFIEPLHKEPSFSIQMAWEQDPKSSPEQIIYKSDNS